MYTATAAEHAAGSLAPEALDGVLASLHTDGFAVVSGLLSEECCALLAASVLEDVQLIRKDAREPTPHEMRTGHGHLQLGLRRYAPYIRSDLVANPLIESVVAAVLGEGSWLGFYNGNINTPQSGVQPLHFDRPYSWKTPEAATAAGQPWPPPTTTLSCSVALTPITPDNGPTEIYPTSHHETAVCTMEGNRLSRDMVAAQAEKHPAASMIIPAGAVCFRDPRMCELLRVLHLLKWPLF